MRPLKKFWSAQISCWTSTSKNQGTGAATNVVVLEDVPDALEFDGQLRELEYEVGTLQPGQTRNIKLRLKASKVGHVRNRVAVKGDGELFAHDEVGLEVVAPRITISGQGPKRRFLEREAVHTFSVTNLGTARCKQRSNDCPIAARVKIRRSRRTGSLRCKKSLGVVDRSANGSANRRQGDVDDAADPNR